MPADAAQARLAGVLDGAAELVDVAVALRVLRQLDRVGAAAGQVDELDRDVVCSGLVAHAGERLDLHVVDAHVDVADAEALQVGHGDRVRSEVLAAHVHRSGEGWAVKLLRGQVFPVFSEMYALHRDDENR